jgi:signal transduction histidine kinase
VLVSEWRAPEFGHSSAVVVKRDFPWILDHIVSRKPVAVCSLNALPREAATDRASLEAHGYKAVLVVPLIAGNGLIGALAFGSAAERAWPEEAVANLRLLSEVLANALARRRTDDELMRSEVMKSAILDSLASGVAVIDAEGCLLKVNTTWIPMAEESRVMPFVSVREGDNLLEVFPTDAAAGVRAVLDRSRVRFVTEYATVSPSGARKWWLFAVSRLNRPEGGAVVTLDDITEQRHAEIEAQQVRQELAHVGRVSTMGELTASLAHQLNQPLTGVMINAQAARRILDRTPLDYDELRETMTDILGDARRASEVIQRVRSLLRRGEFEMTPVDLQGVIGDVANLVGSDALIRNITITLDLAPQPIVVRGDRVQLQQVVLNLLVNAMEAIGQSEERAVYVSCRRTERGDARVIVHDSGVGLATGAEARVFDPFYTTKPNGMGMGLSIALSIVEVHGGSIGLRSAGTRGTIVELTLPLLGAPVSQATLSMFAADSPAARQ